MEKIDKEFLIKYWKKMCSNPSVDFIYEESKTFDIPSDYRERYQIERSPNKEFYSFSIGKWFYEKFISIEDDYEAKKLKITFFINHNIYDFDSKDSDLWFEYEISKKEFNEMIEQFKSPLDFYNNWYDNKFSPEVEKLKKEIREEGKKRIKEVYDEFIKEVEES